MNMKVVIMVVEDGVTPEDTSKSLIIKPVPPLSTSIDLMDVDIIVLKSVDDRLLDIYVRQEDV